MKPLTALAHWMSDQQVLDAPEVILDDFPGALDLLASEGLIVRSRNASISSMKAFSIIFMHARLVRLIKHF
jgi:hypothetical protein